MIKGVLFDFDGTLADSSPGIFSTATKVVVDMGYKGPWSNATLRKFVGPPLRECFRITFSLPDEELDEAVFRYRQIYRQTGYSMCHLYDGIPDLLSELNKLGIKVGVATNKEQNTVERCMEALGITSFFDGIFGTDERGLLKKCDVITRGVEKFSFSPDEVLMIGDTENDRIGAIHANVPFLAVSWGFGYSDDAKNNFNCVLTPKEVLEYIVNKTGGINDRKD